MVDYSRIYNYEFFKTKGRYGVWNNGQLRYDDALPAMAYAYGIKSFDDYKAIFGEHFSSGHLTAHQQVNTIKKNATRSPACVLDIGAGRGEISVQLANNHVLVQAVDACPELERWVKETNKKFFGREEVPGLLRPIPIPLPEAVGEIEFEHVDTVIMCESIEHILKEDFYPLYEKMVPALQKNKGMLIITNNIGWHPIRVHDTHVRLIDEVLYNALAKDAAETIFRQGSHLVLRYE